MIINLYLKLVSLRIKAKSERKISLCIRNKTALLND